MTKIEKKINAPFGYFGSKNNLALQISHFLPPHNCWVEAFCGSAVLTLNKQPAPIEVINDIDEEIVNLFTQLRLEPKKLCSLIELTPYSELELSQARTKKNNLSDLEKARRFLVQSMMAINGVFGKERGGFSYSDSYSRNNTDARVNRWNNLPDRLWEVVERLKNVRIEHKDARKLITRYQNRPATLIYLDPPYFADRTSGYKNDANTEEFHLELLDIANQSKAMIFISGYESKIYDQQLSAKYGWQKHKINSSTRGSTGKVSERTEVIWKNKNFVKAYESQKLPIRLSATEKKYNKINPERINGKK